MDVYTQLDFVLDITSMIILYLAMSGFYMHYKCPKGFHAKQHKIAVSIYITCYTISTINISLCRILSDSNKASFAYLCGFIIYALFGIYQTYILFILRKYITVRAELNASFYFIIILFIIFQIILLTLLLLQNIKYFYVSRILTFLFISKLTQLSFTGIIANSTSNQYNLYNNKLLKQSSYSDAKINANIQMPSQYNKNASTSIAVQTPNDINFMETATKMTLLSTVMVISNVSFIILALISTVYGFLWYFGAIAIYALLIDLTVNILLYDSSNIIYKCLYLKMMYLCSDDTKYQSIYLRNDTNINQHKLTFDNIN